MIDRRRQAVVTGAASGIGLATADLLRNRGWQVIGIDLRGSDLAIDLGHEIGRSALYARVAERCDGILDAVIACAGVIGLDGSAVSVNYFGTLSTLQGLLPLLRRGHQPRAVVVCSAAILHPVIDLVVEACLAGDEAGARAACDGHDQEVYASSKRALATWMRQAAVSPDWAGAGVLLNGIAPGTVTTPMTAPILATKEGRDHLRKMVPIALADWGRPEDVAELVAFLAGDRLGYVVGQVIHIDGGAEVLMRGASHI